MPKNNCSCANDSTKEYTNEAPAFRTHYHLDNGFIPIFNNPSRVLIDLVQSGAPNSLVDRNNCLSCDVSVSTQDKLKVRKKDRPTPYRVPYNHFRKITSCKSDCITNVKINKDLSCNDIDCVPTTYALSRLVDKNGVRNLNNGGNYKNYLQSSGKNYYLNSSGILPDAAVKGKLHTYKIGSIENTVLNKNSKTDLSNDCQLGYSYTTSLNDKSFSLIKMNTTTKKYSNPYHNTSGSVSSKAHIHKKKFRNILAGQSVGKKDGYNNCRNGEFCNLYMKPGPNTKLFMGKTSIQRCIPPRLRGMKQLCNYNLTQICNPSTKYTNPTFQRNDYLTEQDGGFLKISLEHCDLKKNSIISITFIGASAAADHIFAPSVDTNVSSYVTTSFTNQYLETTTAGQDIYEILNYTITDIIVNKNTITWTMPVDVKKGTSYITLFDGGDNIAINNANGIPGRIYANVSVAGHPTLNSQVAWDIIFPSVDCSSRDDTITTSSPTIGNTTAAAGDNINSISIPIITTNSPSILIDDIIQITFYTTYSIGFFNSNVDSEGFGPGVNQASWSLNTTSSNTSPSIKFEDTGIVTNGISSAIWNGTTNPVNINGTTFYKQDLYITVGANLTSTSTNLVINNNTTIGTTPEINTIPSSPLTFSIKYQISSSCFTSTSISTIREILDICYYRTFNGTGLIQPYGSDPFDVFNKIANEPVGASIPGVVTYNPENFAISFVYSNENFIQGDIIILDLYSTYPNGYLNTANYPNGISNWNESNSNDGIPKLRIAKYNPVTSSFISEHSYTSAIWDTSNDTIVSIGSVLYYKQTISITLDSNPPTTTGNNEALQITLVRASTIGNNENIIYTNLLTDHPTTAGTIKYSISCNCYTGTGIQTGYSFQGPCYNRNGSFTNTSMSIANYEPGNDPVIDPITSYGAVNGEAISPEIVLFTFSLTSDNLKGGDVISFRITTDYGSSTHGYFTSSVASNNFSWYLNEKPDGAAPDNLPSIWLEQGGNVLASPSGIESISFSNSSYNTTTNVYTQIMYVTIGNNISSILSSNGALILGIYGDDDIIAGHPTSTYNVYYEIDSYCWTSTGTQNGYGNDPCSGRGGSLTGGSITKYPNNMDGGEDLEYIFLPFTPTSDGNNNTSSKIVPGDIIIVKIYTTPTTFSFFDTTWISNNPFGVSVNSGSYPGIYIEDPNGQNSGTPLANAITDFTVTDNGVINGKRVNTLSIQLSSPLGQTEWIAQGDSSKIIMQNGINTASWINQFPNANGTLNYEIDVNCLTSTGSGNGFSFSEVAALSNLSLLPANFAGENRATGSSPALLAGTTVYKTITQPWTQTVQRFGITTSGTDYNVVLKFTISESLSSGDTIKLTMYRAYDASLNFSDIFTTDTWPVNSPANEFNDSYIELLSGSTAKNLTSVSLGNYNTTAGSQEITLTVGDTIPASNITINFYNEGFNNWQQNVRDGTSLTFDLEVTDHSTSTGNLGWYVQDLGVSSTFTLNSTWLFNSGPENSTRFLYRHYSAIPQNSKIRLIFDAQHVVGVGFTYTIFDTNTDSNGNPSFSNAQSYLVNTSTPTTNQVGVTVTSKDLNNSSTSNNISIGSFTLGGLASANYVAANNDGSYPNTNYGSIEYLEFTVTQSGGIPGDTVTGTSAGGKYIEIDIDMRYTITQYLTSNISGNLNYSIQVFDSNNVLIGGAYNFLGFTVN